MNNIDIITELSERYKELNEEFKSVQDLVYDIDFVFDYTEEEQHLFYKTIYAMEEHCGALLKLIRFLKKQEREEGQEPHHCGLDASCQVGDGSAVVNSVPNSIKELVGMQIVSVMPPGWKCQGCAYDSDYFRCEKKVELVGGYMICLAPLNNSIVTE